MIRVRCVAGNVHWLELRAIPMLDLNGTIVGVSGTLSDVTARVSVEVELRRQQTLYRLIAENSSDIIALVALHGGRFTYVSPSTEHVLGYTADDVLGVEWWTLLDSSGSRADHAVGAVRSRTAARHGNGAGSTERRDAGCGWRRAPMPCSRKTARSSAIASPRATSPSTAQPASR